MANKTVHLKKLRINITMPSTLPPLYVPPAELNEEDNVFHGDLFSREKLANSLTACIDRLPHGGVIAIDAPWGEGKSWFGGHWHKKLKNEGYRTAFINAFERDYVEEPFVMLASEMLSSLKPEQAEPIKKSAIAVTKALAPVVAKGAFNGVVKFVTGTTDFSEQIDDAIEKIGDAVADAGEKQLAKQIEDYEKNKFAVDVFRKTLQEIAAKESKPIVIFVDELDRCRPEFAVKLIERVKHFFETPAVVFILLLNIEQLSGAIKGAYGENIDSTRYLFKFFHLQVSLPKRQYENNEPGDIVRFCGECLVRYGLQPNQAWVDKVAEAANVLQISLRDVERCVGLLSMFGMHLGQHVWFYAWPMIVKITRPQLFSEVARLQLPSNDQLNANQQLLVYISKIRVALAASDDMLWAAFQEIHNSAMQNSPLSRGGKAMQLLTELGIPYRQGMRVDLLLSRIFKTVDIQVK
jgi:hypothetical protein